MLHLHLVVLMCSWFDSTQFSYHCVHPIHAKMFSIQMLLHFSQIVQRVCTLVLFISLCSKSSSVCVYVCLCMYVCMYVSACMGACMYVSVCTYAYYYTYKICVFVCVFVSRYMCLCHNGATYLLTYTILSKMVKRLSVQIWLFYSLKY